MYGERCEGCYDVLVLISVSPNPLWLGEKKHERKTSWGLFLYWWILDGQVDQIKHAEQLGSGMCRANRRSGHRG